MTLRTLIIGLSALVLAVCLMAVFARLIAFTQMQTALALVPQNVTASFSLEQTTHNASLIAKNLLGQQAKDSALSIDAKVIDDSSVIVFSSRGYNAAQMKQEHTAALQSFVGAFQKVYQGQEIAMYRISSDTERIAFWRVVVAAVLITLSTLLWMYFIGRLYDAVLYAIDEMHKEDAQVSKPKTWWNNSTAETAAATHGQYIQKKDVEEYAQEETAVVQEVPFVTLDDLNTALNYTYTKEQKRDVEMVATEDTITAPKVETTTTVETSQPPASQGAQSAGAAPGNLPVIDSAPTAKHAVAAEDTLPDLPEEPTDEELKARLNKLLRGEL